MFYAWPIHPTGWRARLLQLYFKSCEGPALMKEDRWQQPRVQTQAADHCNLLGNTQIEPSNM